VRPCNTFSHADLDFVQLLQYCAACDTFSIPWHFKRCAGQLIVQFAQDVLNRRAYAIKFFLDEDSFYAEAALYVAVFPHLRKWLSKRATDALVKMTEQPGVERSGKFEVAQTMQAAASRFLPQVLLGPYLNNSRNLTYATPDNISICIEQHNKPVLHDPVLTSFRMQKTCCRWRHCEME
jgi:hypothetical protein